MYYYIFYRNDKMSGFLASEDPISYGNAVEVTKEEYENTLGECGLPYASRYNEKIKEDILNSDSMTEIRAQIQAQADRGEFIEDCIAEMAMQVYSNV